MDEQIRRNVGMEKNVEVLPGTEIMTDTDGVHFIHAHNRGNAQVLIPQPSNREDDPLNWSPRVKTLLMICQASYVFISMITALSIAPLTPLYEAEWNKDLEAIALLTGVLVITLGYSNFIIIPCSDLFGRRFTLLVCCVIVLASDIWQATAKSYGSFLAARAIAGIGAASNESIMTSVIADTFFLHERGTYITLYFWCYFCGVTIGPIIAGGIAEHTTWRWFFGACTIAQFLNFVTLLFFVPETRRVRDAPMPVTTSVVHEEPKSTSSPLHTEDIENSIVVDDMLGRGKPSKAQYSILPQLDRTAIGSLAGHLTIPVQIFFYPIVLWASFTMAMAADALLGLNLIQSPSLAGPPYSFSTENVGFASFAITVGCCIGLATAGPLSDWIAKRATERNGGIREPEMRLMALIPFIVVAVLGMLAIGVGLQQGWPWEAIVIFGYTCIGIQVVSIAGISVTYAIDCYKPIAGQIMVTVTVVKNTFGFGLTYFINDWAVKSGYLPPMMMFLGLTAGFAILGLVVFGLWGKKFRYWTRNSSVHRIKY